MGNANATCFKDDSAGVSLRGRVSGFAQNITAGPVMSAGEGIVNLGVYCETDRMKTRRSRDHGHRFPAEIISHAVWLYSFLLKFP